MLPRPLRSRSGSIVAVFQIAFALGIFLEEDCLTLNIYAPVPSRFSAERFRPQVLVSNSGHVPFGGHGCRFSVWDMRIALRKM